MSIFRNILHFFSPKGLNSANSENSNYSDFRNVSQDRQSQDAREKRALMSKILVQASGYVRASLKDWNDATENAKDNKRPRRSDLYDIYEKTMIDLHTKSEINVRKLRLRGHPHKWMVSGKEVKYKPGQWFFEFLNIVLDTLFWGHSLIEFDITSEVTAARLVPRAHVVPEFGIILPKITDNEGFSYRDTALGRYALEINTGDLGLLHTISNHIIRKTGMERAWLEFGQRFGLPIPYAKSSIANPVELQKVDDFLSKMSAGTWARFPEGVDVDFIEAANIDSYELFLRYIELKNSEVSKTILGQTMLTNDNGTGSYTKAIVSERVAEDILKDDKTYVANIINLQLIPFLTQFGVVPQGLSFEWDDVSKLPVMDQWEIDFGLMQMGYRFSPEYLMQQYGAPVMPPAITKEKKGYSNFQKLSSPIVAQKKAYTPSIMGQNATVDTPYIYSAKSEDDLALSFNQMLKDLYEGIISQPQAYTQFAEALANQYHTAVTEGYGDIEYGMKDVRMLSFLSKNMFLFSGAKSYEELQQLKDLLKDDDGNHRGWNAFKTAAQNINKTHNVIYLGTEYQHAIASAQMASKWTQIRLEADILPLLQYEAINDDRTRPEHAALDGVVLPVNDEFWLSFYPPNGYGCRCNARQLAANEAPITENLPDTPDLNPIFKNNVGINGIVFPDSHPYIAQIPKKVWANIAEKMGNAYEVNLYKEEKRNANGNFIEVHPHHDRGDYQNNLAQARQLMESGYNVRIRPHSFEQGIKNPEAWIQMPNGEWVLGDFKNFEGTKKPKNALQQRVEEANKQGCNVVVVEMNTVEFTVKQQKEAIELAFNPKRNKGVFDLLLVYPKHKRVVRITREEVKTFEFVAKLIPL